MVGGQRIHAHVVSVLFCLAMFAILSACQRRAFLSQHHWVDTDSAIAIGSTADDSITIHYIGCSGFFVSKDTNTLLFDPYFTYRALSTLKLTTEENISGDLGREIDRIFTRAIGINRDIFGAIDALLIDHAHVDHFGDVPYLFHSGHLHRNTPVVGSSTTIHYLHGHDIYPPVAEGVEDSAMHVRWIPVNRSLRILPIISEHAPHIVIYGREFNFASGRAERRDRTRPLAPCYGTGQTLAYLVDFLNADGTVNFRLYHSSAASSAPYGHIPDSIRRQHDVDVAILCAASFNQADNFPENLVCNLKPRHIVLAHWEDFLVSSLQRIKTHPQANYLYNFRKLFRRTDKLQACMRRAGDTVAYSLPNVDTRLTFFY